MERAIKTVDVQRQFEQVLTNVVVNGDRYLAYDGAVPVAAIVPIALYQQWQSSRESFFADLRATAERANLSEEVALQLVTEAVAAVRTADTR